MTCQEANDAQRLQLLREASFEELENIETALTALAMTGGRRAEFELVEVQAEMIRRFAP